MFIIIIIIIIIVAEGIIFTMEPHYYYHSVMINCVFEPVVNHNVTLELQLYRY